MEQAEIIDTFGTYQYPGRVTQAKAIFQDKAGPDWAAAGPSWADVWPIDPKQSTIPNASSRPRRNRSILPSPRRSTDWAAAWPRGASAWPIDPEPSTTPRVLGRPRRNRCDSP